MNSFQKQALEDLRCAGFEAWPRGNWVAVATGSSPMARPEPIYSVAGVDAYIAKNGRSIKELTQ